MTQPTQTTRDIRANFREGRLPDIPVYLINLDGSDERLHESTRQLYAAGIVFERVPAFDGRQLLIEEFPDYDAKGALRYMGRPLRGGEIGCYLSHIDCARRFLETDAPTCVVLEDDVELRDSFASGIEAILGWLHQGGDNWDVINIGAKRIKIHTRRSGFEVSASHCELSQAHYFPTTTTGLIWSRPGARAFLQAHKRIFAPVDIYLRHWQARRNRGWAVMPGLVTTTGADSVIAPSASPRREADGRHLLYGFFKQRRVIVNKVLAYFHKWDVT